MRVAWFTPFSSKSAIARFSVEVVTELSRLSEVDVWHPEVADERPWPGSQKRFRRAADIDRKALARYDLIFYNLGNHFGYHGEIWAVSREVPGVVIMHDFVMHHFFAAYYFEHVKDPSGYVAAMERAYGAKGRVLATKMVRTREPRVWESDAVSEFPLFDDALKGAYGVIAHSDFLAEKVRPRFPGLVAKIPLAYEPAMKMPTLTRKELGILDDEVLLITAGQVNPNKRVDSVIRALSDLGVSNRKVVYAVLGPYEASYHRKLIQLVRDLKLEKTVRFLGYVREEVLHSYLVHADLCAGLRYPATESASASVIEALWYAKPVIVTDTGFYQELPDDSVVKIDVAREREQLPEALRRLIANPALRQQLSASARALAESRFHPRHYVQELLKFSWQVRKNKPVFSLTQRIATELEGLGITSEMSVARTIADNCYDLFFEDQQK